MKIILLVLGLIVTVLLGVFFLGPRVPVDTQTIAVTLPQDLDLYLTESEARFSDIIPGAEKTIVWANPEKSQTNIALVYLHGYSATRQETAPLADDLAKTLGANLFYTRLTGHGRTGEAMAEASVNDWLQDTYESIEIGKRLGKKIIIIGTSTGGTLALWQALASENNEILAYILISPNLAPSNPQSEILTLPWGSFLVQALIGPTYSWTPGSEEQAQYWTHSYPSTSLPVLMALVQTVRNSNLSQIQAPVLVVYSKLDTVVNPLETEKMFTILGSEVKLLVPIEKWINADNHVLAGRILAPDHTSTVKEIIMGFLEPLIVN